MHKGLRALSLKMSESFENEMRERERARKRDR
jgi:hypothetical protein